MRLNLCRYRQPNVLLCAHLKNDTDGCCERTCRGSQHRVADHHGVRLIVDDEGCGT